jgi:flavorubredoxin
MKTLKLKDDIHWVGSLDPGLKVFDIIMHTEFGTSYNSYIVKGSEKTALIETVKIKFFDEYMDKLKELNIDVMDVDYIVINHTEPDHSGSIEKILNMNPKIKLVGSKSAIEFMKHICNRSFEAIEVKNSDELSLGNKTFRFIDAKFLHWPDTIFTYIVEDKVLFTCDSFGAHYSLDTVLQSTIKNQDDYMSAFNYYYENILFPYKQFFLQAISRIENLDIDMICTGHGPILDEDPWKIINLSKEYSLKPSQNEGKLVVIPYVSAYGYTKELADEIKKGIEETGVKVELYDMVTANEAEVLEKIYWADGILFGSPTMLGDALKPIWNLLTSMNAPVHKGKIASAFGSYGWSGEAVPNIIQRLKQIRVKIFGEGLKVRFKPSDEQLYSAYDFGVQFGNSVQSCIVPEKIVINTKKEEQGEIYSWKCTVCGEIIEGSEPPKVCPVCGVGPDYFEKVEDEEVGKKVSDKKVSDKKENFLIIGSSGAGMSAVEEIRKRNKESEITIISKEDVKGYYRPQLSKMLSRDISIDSLSIKNDKWLKENNIKLILDKEAIKIDSKNKMVILNDDSKLEYTKLIIATGAECFMPPIPGNDRNGVFTLRNIKDSVKIKEYAKDKKSAVVVGGGILGLEIASELKNIGLDVTVIEMANRILSRQLDSQASLVLEELVKNSGIEFRKEASTKEIVGNGNVTGVLLGDGEVVKADVVIVSTGVKANIQIVQGTDIEVKRAIVVNDKMETGIKDIYACGDCCEYNGVNFALWSEAIEQGKVAGINAVGGESVYEQIIPLTTLNAFNSSIFSIGDIGSDPDKVYKVYETKEEDEHNYKKMYFLDGLLVGGILIGDTAKAVILIEGFKKSRSMEEMIERLKY